LHNILPYALSKQAPKKATVTSFLVDWLVGCRINHIQLQHASQSALALNVGDAFQM
jgi:hypothetical protein